MTEDPLVGATYALVVATVLLFLASLAPLLLAFLASRRARRSSANKVVPDINMLLSMLRGNARQISKLTSASLAYLDRAISSAETCQDHIAEILEQAPENGLEFTNEIFLVRHFVSSAQDDLRLLARRAEDATGETSMHNVSSVRTHSHHSPGKLTEESRIAKVAGNYIAAYDSLLAAEKLLPKKSRQIDGARFWDRYRETLSARADAGARKVVDYRKD